MSRVRKRWLYGISAAVGVIILALMIAASVLARRFEPFIREQAISYMSERFDCNVELAALRIRMPKLSPINVLLAKGRGATVHVEGEGISMRYRNAPDLPQLFAIRKFSLEVDLGTLFADEKVVNAVRLDGMEIHVPPKGERRALGPSTTPSSNPAPKVLIRRVEIKNARLAIVPKERTKHPLAFDL